MTKIKIVTNTQSNDLYTISKEYYQHLGFDMVGIDGRHRYYGFKVFNDMIRDKQFDDTDWIIYVDEDCFITDSEAMLDLLQYQIDNNIHCCGVPDGGVISHRFHNPISINPFFMILNVREIRKKYNVDNVSKMRYGQDLDKFIPTHLNNKEKPHSDKLERIIHPSYQPYGVVYDDFEEAYKLFFWLLRNDYKIFYLDAYDYPQDDYTTVVKNHCGIDFCYHTWFARDWNDPSNQNRIMKIKEYCDSIKKI